MIHWIEIRTFYTLDHEPRSLKKCAGAKGGTNFLSDCLVPFCAIWKNDPFSKSQKVPGLKPRLPRWVLRPCCNLIYSRFQYRKYKNQSLYLLVFSFFLHMKSNRYISFYSHQVQLYTSESFLLSHDSSKCVCIKFLKGNKWPKYQLSKHLDKEQSKTFFIITHRD